MLCHEDSITIFKTLPDPSSFHDFITGFVTRLTRRVPPMEQELLDNTMAKIKRTKRKTMIYKA
jgi:hypothetical protein